MKLHGVLKKQLALLQISYFEVMHTNLKKNAKQNVELKMFEISY